MVLYRILGTVMETKCCGNGVVRGGVEEFTAFYLVAEPLLRRALMAAHGPELGREATASCLAWAWEHWERVGAMRQPLGYLYRLGQSRARVRRLRSVYARPSWDEPWMEPALASGLASLTERQRVAAVLVHGYGWTMRRWRGCWGFG